MKDLEIYLVTNTKMLNTEQASIEFLKNVVNGIKNLSNYRLNNDGFDIKFKANRRGRLPGMSYKMNQPNTHITLCKNPAIRINIDVDETNKQLRVWIGVPQDH